MNLLTEQQIQAQVSAIRRRLKNGARHFAIRSTGNWSGPDRLSIDGVDHLVQSCVSDLQIRESLLMAEQENMPSVLLCSMSRDAVGDDVIDRLAKRHIFSSQVSEMVAELFSVSPARIDPRVLKTKVLMGWTTCSAISGSGTALGFPVIRRWGSNNDTNRPVRLCARR